MGWQEWPLFVFTVIAQSAIGAFWWCCAALLAGNLSADQYSHLNGLMLVVWAMAAFAFSASAFHLGTPLRAINASFRFGRSPLSNEAVFGGAFVGLGVVGWIMSTWDIGSDTSQLFVLGLTVVCSIAFLASMIWFYMMPTVPTWNTPLTPAAYVLTTIIGGSAVAAALFAAAGIVRPDFLRLGPVTLVSAALVVAVAVALRQNALLPGINSSIKRATDLSPHYASLMAIRFVILFSALGLWWLDMLRLGTLTVSAAITCVVLILVAEMIGRGVHFGLHMTVGLR